jgi:UDP-N-acetylglucosamine--N-acetylmuramyl-(pentapeptide) pyrophosphoryl-undecaprenol N-acetylglucosamine transferase
MKHLPADKAVHTGSPIREEILQGNADKGHKLCDFTRSKPVMLIIGGSLGSQKINNAVRAGLDALLPQFQIVHICGKGNVDPAFDNVKGYRQFEYVSSELPDLFAMTDLFVSRAGSNAIFEFLALKKPHVLIPLSRAASRGDQILNAKSFEKMGYSHVLLEEDLTDASLLKAINETYADRDRYVTNMQNSNLKNTVDQIVTMIHDVTGTKK